jgi:hypothetical protein
MRSEGGVGVSESPKVARGLGREFFSASVFPVPAVNYSLACSLHAAGQESILDLLTISSLTIYNREHTGVHALPLSFMETLSKLVPTVLPLPNEHETVGAFVRPMMSV